MIVASVNTSESLNYNISIQEEVVYASSIELGKIAITIKNNVLGIESTTKKINIVMAD